MCKLTGTEKLTLSQIRDMSDNIDAFIKSMSIYYALMCPYPFHTITRQMLFESLHHLYNLQLLLKEEYFSENTSVPQASNSCSTTS